MRAPASSAPPPSSPRAGEEVLAPAPPRRARLILRLGVTVLLCTTIAWLIDWPAFWEVVQEARVSLLIVAILLRPVGTWLSASKWQRLLRIHGVDYSLAVLLRWYFAATFLSQFLPTSIGGDAYRIYCTYSRSGGTRAVSAVLVERATGIIALLMLGTVAAVFVFATSGHRLAQQFAAVMGGGFVLLLLTLALVPRMRVPRVLERRRFWSKLAAAWHALRADFARNRRSMATVMSLSFLFHLNRILVIWLILRALQEPLSYLVLTLASAIVELAGLLPISISGLGVVEGAFIAVTRQFGLAPETALAAALLLRILLVPHHVIGAICYLRPPAAETAPAVPSKPYEGTGQSPAV